MTLYLIESRRIGDCFRVDKSFRSKEEALAWLKEWSELLNM